MPPIEAQNDPGLTDEQLATLRTRLEQRRDELRDRMAREQSVARATDQVSEAMDAAELTREQGDAALLAEHARAQLREVEAALRRMETGHYGISVVTGLPISYKRLLALPWARRDRDE